MRADSLSTSVFVTMRLETLRVNHRNSVALIVTACNGLYRNVGFMASMVAKYALLCTFVWEVVVPIGC